MNKFYITTAIDYANDTIHIGHAFQKVLADIQARFYTIKIGEENVFFLTGTDEYGQNIAKTAEKNGITPQKWVDKISQTDQIEQDSLNISYNRFIRTTDQDHTEVAQEIWRRVEGSGDIYLGEFTGLYCPSCEAYYTESDLVDGKCSFHPTLEIKPVTEENFFFKWSKYQAFLIEHIGKHSDFIYPKSRHKEILEFAKRGIKDIPISRTSFTWGISVPNHPGHVEYVWFDALTNYLTGIGFLKDPEKFEKFWPADIHILGVDNLRWHALLWPAMLKSAGLKLPKTILVNGFLSLNGQKISKTSGNVIKPSEWTAKFGADAVRYYLVRYLTLDEGGDISEEKFKEVYNADLANGLGNLVARVAKLCETHNVIARSESSSDVAISLKFDQKMTKHLDKFKFNEALNHIWGEITEVDKKINEEKPWELEGEKLKTVLEDLVKKIQHIAFNLQPFLPETSENILKQFSGQIKSAPPLFPRI